MAADWMQKFDRGHSPHVTGHVAENDSTRGEDLEASSSVGWLLRLRVWALIA
jgi:hypothetical protein